MYLIALYEILVTIILGVVQGLSEFLPISSSAHLRLIGTVLGGEDLGLTITNILQLGTMLAVYQFFWADLKKYWHRIIQIISNTKARQDFWLNLKNWIDPQTQEEFEDIDVEIAQILVATIPILLIGGIYSVLDLSSNFRANWQVLIFLILGSLLMLWAEKRYSRFKQTKKLKSGTFNWQETLILGLFQALAVLPGFSRSGSTVSGALILAHNRPKSVRFSFLMSIPAVTIAGVLAILELILELQNSTLNTLPGSNFDIQKLSLLSIILGFVFSYLVGIWCLKWLLKYLSQKTFRIFIIYRLMLSLIIFLLLVFQIF